MQYPKFKVTVQCATFQHAKYITDAMNGFTMQQTDFPFVCTIIDDASTDGEQAVISNYLDTHFDLSEDGVAYKKETDYAHIIYARHKTNKNCYFAVLFLKENHYSQKKDRISYLKEWRENVDYIALCEGDDYWINPLKLQKQVEYMEQHHECGLCFTNFVNSNKKRHRQHFVNDNKYEQALIEDDLIIGTLTSLYRTTVYQQLPKNWIGKNWYMGDLPLWIELSHQSNTHFINETTSVYRVLEESASHSRNIKFLSSFQINAYEIKQFYNQLYGNKYDVTYPYQKIMKCAYELNDCKTANRTIRECLKAGHYNIRTFIFYWGTIIPGLKYILNLYYK